MVRLVASLGLVTSLLNGQSTGRAPNPGGLVSVTDFGAVADGHTDNSQTLGRALGFAAIHPGTRLHFPCSSGGNIYRITTPLSIPPYVSLVGDGEKCAIFYDPSVDPGSVNSAFSITSGGWVAIDNLALKTGSAHPPASILELGRVKGLTGANKILNSTIEGYATKALVYSQASENNIWLGDTLRFMGGGAQYGFYTSAEDDLGICNGCQVASNLSLYFDHFIIVANTDETSFTAIADRIGGGTGDHYFERGYIGLNHKAGSIGLEFISGAQNQGGPNSQVSVKDIRIENGGYGLYFRKKNQGAIYNVDVGNVTWASGVVQQGEQAVAPGSADQTYFAYGDDGLKLYRFTMSRNIANRHTITGPSSFDSLNDSTLDESYGPISIRSTASGNILMLRQPATVSMPDSQRPLNTWIFGNRTPEYGGDLKAAATIVVTASFHIIKSGTGPITSIKPPVNFQVGEILKLENGTASPLQFAVGADNPVRSAFTLPPGRFVSLLWDGRGWVPGMQ
jgi:hypothetical protein